MVNGLVYAWGPHLPIRAGDNESYFHPKTRFLVKVVVRGMWQSHVEH